MPGLRFAGAAMAAALLSLPLAAAQGPLSEGPAHGFPELRDLSGRSLAAGDFAQWLERDHLHVRIQYDFGDGRVITETSSFRQRPRLRQDTWSWRETRGGRAVREFAIDFGARRATARALEAGELKQWSEDADFDPARTFAGFGFSLAIKAARERLRGGTPLELQTVGFMPKPRVATVEIRFGGVDRMQMGGRVIRGDRYVIHPKVPWFADLFVDIPDTRLWLIHPEPTGFLRLEGPLVEPDDPVIRVDLLPGGKSGPATAVRTPSAP
jgi:hypothetical protein